jgi:hypothetical protein
MGGIARSLLILGRVFYTFVDEIVMIMAGSEALFSMLYVLINGKSSRGAGSYRAGHRLSPWEVCGACGRAIILPGRGVVLGSMKSSGMLYVTNVLLAH